MVITSPEGFAPHEPAAPGAGVAVLTAEGRVLAIPPESERSPPPRQALTPRQLRDPSQAALQIARASQQVRGPTRDAAVVWRGIHPDGYPPVAMIQPPAQAAREVDPSTHAVSAPESRESRRLATVPAFFGWILVWLGALLGVLMVTVPLLLVFGVSVPLVPSVKKLGTLTAADLTAVTVSGATLLLASFTFRLASLTGRAVRATQTEVNLTVEALALSRTQARAAEEMAKIADRQASIASETLAASWRPFLVEVPLRTYMRESVASFDADRGAVTYHQKSDGTILLSVPLRNIGSGPAILLESMLRARDQAARSESASNSIVAPGELTRVYFDLAPSNANQSELRAAVAAGEEWDVEVDYLDQVGTKGWQTTLHMKTGPRGSWIVAVAEFFNADDMNEPYAVSVGNASY